MEWKYYNTIPRYFVGAVHEPPLIFILDVVGESALEVHASRGR